MSIGSRLILTSGLLHTAIMLPERRNFLRQGAPGIPVHWPLAGSSPTDSASSGSPGRDRSEASRSPSAPNTRILWMRTPDLLRIFQHYLDRLRQPLVDQAVGLAGFAVGESVGGQRSEERRVGKEGRSRWWPG